MAVTFVFLSAYTVLSNTLVCIVYLSDRGKNLHTVGNFYVVSLAVADILVGLTVEPLSIAHHWSRDKRTLFCYYIFAVMSCVSSILHICGMMVDRYIAVSRPFRYRTSMSSHRVRYTVVFMWLFAIHFGVLPLIGWRSASFQIYLYGLSVLTPLAVMFAAYRGLLQVLKSKAETLRDGFSEGGRMAVFRLRRRIERERRISNTVLIMTMAFLVSWGPFVVLDFVLVFCEVCRTLELRIARDICLTLGFASSGINPVLYAWRVPHFRKGLRLLLRCLKKTKGRRNSQVFPTGNLTVRALSQATLRNFGCEDMFSRRGSKRKESATATRWLELKSVGSQPAVD